MTFFHVKNSLDMQAAQHKEAQEQAELKGVTWQPRISKMARDLKRESSSPAVDPPQQSQHQPEAGMSCL